jgi:hypothetical protein
MKLIEVKNKLLFTDIFKIVMFYSFSQKQLETKWFIIDYVVHFIFKWVIDCCLTASEQLFSYIMALTSYIRWDEVCFVLYQHAYICLVLHG